MMKNNQLEQALMFASQGNDIASLKSLARQESARADQITQLLVALLTTTGPIKIRQSAIQQASAGFTMTLCDEDWIILAIAES